MKKTHWAVSLAIAALLSGCDTLHGVQFELASDTKLALPHECIEEGLKRVGLELVPTSPTQAIIREPGKQDYMFFASYAVPHTIVFYAQVMHEPFSCNELQRFVPRLRAAVKSTQDACSLPASRVIVMEKWNQESCGI